MLNYDIIEEKYPKSKGQKLIVENMHSLQISCSNES